MCRRNRFLISGWAIGIDKVLFTELELITALLRKRRSIIAGHSSRTEYIRFDLDLSNASVI
jgi:hypothetical protein